MDYIFHYTVNTHEIGMNYDDDDAKVSDSTDTFLAHMVERTRRLPCSCRETEIGHEQELKSRCQQV
jgi:hypothetical protein